MLVIAGAVGRLGLVIIIDMGSDGDVEPREMRLGRPVGQSAWPARRRP